METSMMTNIQQETKTKAVKQAEDKMETTSKKPRSIRVVAPKTVAGFLGGFVKNTLGDKTNHGNYSVRKENGVETLVFTSYEHQYNFKTENTVKNVAGNERLAVRLEDGSVLSNANRLQFCGTHAVYGGFRSYNRGQSPAQEILEQAGAIPVPFSVFENAKLKIAHAKVVVKSPSETITIKTEEWNKGEKIEKDETRHYVGACLLEVKDHFFLFDIDREELKHKIFNPFVLKLPRAVRTIEEAYLSLKPAKVVMAELEGKPVERQGEWFFVKRFDELPDMPKPPQELMDLANNPPDARKLGAIQAHEYYQPGNTHGCRFQSNAIRKAYEKAASAWDKAREELLKYSPQRGELQQGDGRPNHVEKYVNYRKMTLVSGEVTHSERVHRDIVLQGWWEPVPNTAVKSWQISGDVD